MKKIFFTLIALLLGFQASLAVEMGYIDMYKVIDNYSLAQKYKKELSKKYNSINSYIKVQENAIKKATDTKTKIEIQQKGISELEKKQKEYIALKNKREEEILNNIKKEADKIRIQKKLDIIIKKETTITGGIDCTQDIINGLK